MRTSIKKLFIYWLLTSSKVIIMANLESYILAAQSEA
ncbi:hypothetical protein CFIICLFH_4421 [Methylobacterium goesingense]|nr:hypothetical protein CFIICLFH_4421 [Methylobacterium goesingense]